MAGYKRYSLMESSILPCSPNCHAVMIVILEMASSGIKKKMIAEGL
jgi:hypothetical protein